ncbi:hypothetical protein OCU04_007365 [Sclerotinia nivalis]|uniref:Uncharacterized protein n=1 Tax=Sclerotinia nivalis TaxID=352851 RepID=A0A9X0AJH5_9HELO|nr:hypothetical protein OCU04_007365 [Sclerotinia nivalis]
MPQNPPQLPVISSNMATHPDITNLSPEFIRKILDTYVMRGCDCSYTSSPSPKLPPSNFYYRLVDGFFVFAILVVLLLIAIDRGWIVVGYEKSSRCSGDVTNELDGSVPVGKREEEETQGLYKWIKRELERWKEEKEESKRKEDTLTPVLDEAQGPKLKVIDHELQSMNFEPLRSAMRKRARSGPLSVRFDVEGKEVSPKSSPEKRSPVFTPNCPDEEVF